MLNTAQISIYFEQIEKRKWRISEKEIEQSEAERNLAVAEIKRNGWKEWWV